MREYNEIRYLTEEVFKMKMRECMGNIDNATESTLTMIKKAYKDGMMNQKEMLNAIECTMAKRIREECKEYVGNV